MVRQSDNNNREKQVLSGSLMQVELLAGQALSAAHLRVWSDIVDNNPELDSPFFRPEFTQLMSQLRNRVEVAIIRNAYQIVGFFPFRRVSPVVGQSVGGRLSGAEGIICREGIEVSLEELLDRIQLSSWDFEQVPANQSQFAPYAFSETMSHYIDLSEGYETYCDRKKDSGSKRIIKLNSLARKLEREQGPVEFQFHDDRLETLDKLIELKSQQFHDTHHTDVFNFDWTRNLLLDLQETDHPKLRGRLSTLSVGGQPIAISYALQSQHVLHGWFTTFDPNYSRYSPGSILILKIAEAAGEAGITRFDLGPGEQLFKQTLKSGSTFVCGGSLSNDPMRRWIKWGLHETKEWISHSPARFTLDVLRPIKGWFDMK
ncbi:MAG: GNAT family N-acetyltransferase [Planctomycetaceae bacterium]|nr:GNAT family N-acetyltransferase [Planctomycetaceae bacterium]